MTTRPAAPHEQGQEEGRDAVGPRFLADARKAGTCAIGKYASVPGKFWNGCPDADKEKRYNCIVNEFLGVQDFGGGIKRGPG